MNRTLLLAKDDLACPDKWVQEHTQLENFIDDISFFDQEEVVQESGDTHDMILFTTVVSGLVRIIRFFLTYTPLSSLLARLATYKCDDLQQEIELICNAMDRFVADEVRDATPIYSSDVEKRGDLGVGYFDPLPLLKERDSIISSWIVQVTTDRRLSTMFHLSYRQQRGLFNLLFISSQSRKGKNVLTRIGMDPACQPGCPVARIVILLRFGEVSGSFQKRQGKETDRISPPPDILYPFPARALYNSIEEECRSPYDYFHDILPPDIQAGIDAIFNVLTHSREGMCVLMEMGKFGLPDVRDKLRLSDLQSCLSYWLDDKTPWNQKVTNKVLEYIEHGSSTGRKRQRSDAGHVARAEKKAKVVRSGNGEK